MRGPLALALITTALGQEVFLAARPRNESVKLGSVWDFINANGCNNCEQCSNLVEGYDSTRQQQHQRMVAACQNYGCSQEEVATVIAMAMLESDNSCATDTSKGWDQPNSNFSPFNMNIDQLSRLGCDTACAQSLGQYCGSYDIEKAVGYVVTGLRAQGSIGNTCDFMNFHRGGYGGWQECLSGFGHDCSCQCQYDCKGYKNAISDMARIIMQNQQYLTDGEHLCMYVHAVANDETTTLPALSSA